MFIGQQICHIQHIVWNAVFLFPGYYEISKKRAKAAKESEKIANARIESANIEAKEIVENAKVSAEKEKQRIIESAQREIAAMVVVATKKLLEEQSDSFNQFISATKEGSENEWLKMRLKGLRLRLSFTA